MSDIGFGIWAWAIILFGIMCYLAYVLGEIVTQVGLRFVLRNRRESYDRWGVAVDLFETESFIRSVGRAGLYVVGTLLSGLLAHGSTSFLMGEVTWIRNPLELTFFVAVCAILLGNMVVVIRFSELHEKAIKLENLREVFHQRFQKSDLLSVYESLQAAPPLFWEEYTQLPDDEISEDTNQKYRERAEPYNNMQFKKYTRIIISLAFLTLILTLALAVMQLIQ